MSQGISFINILRALFSPITFPRKIQSQSYMHVFFVRMSFWQLFSTFVHIYVRKKSCRNDIRSKYSYVGKILMKLTPGADAIKKTTSLGFPI